MFKTVWPLGKASHSHVSVSRSKDSISEDLHSEVRSAPPQAKLSYILRNNLERLDKAERQKIVSVTKADGCAPLFVACKKGNLEIVLYLIETCGADVEQKGIFEVLDDKTSHRVSPLWCASVSGRLSIVKCLIRHGANVNSLSDTGSSPVRSACFMTHKDIVEYLVEEAGADILLPNYNGGTCLINSVQSSDLCEYLLEHGATVNAQDIQLKTALHYAIQEHRFETTKLLLRYGADPFLCNRYGDDALQTAALKGATVIFTFLLENIKGYTSERKAEMHELMGSTFLDEHHDIQMAISFWKLAISLRLSENLGKPVLTYSPLYTRIVDNVTGQKIEVKEFQTLEELENISTDMEQMRIVSLLIAERILGCAHKDVIFRIMYRGAAYADLQMYPLCISLWIYALQLRINKDSILYGDSCFTALALIRLYLDLDRNRDIEREMGASPGQLQETLSIEDLMGTFDLLVSQLPDASKLVRVRPIFKRQQESYDRCLRCCTHLLYLLLKVPKKTPSQWAKLRATTRRLVNFGVRMCATGDTILHMAVSRTNIVRSHFFLDDHQVYVFPNFEVAKFMIDCGADVNALNDARQTPLHIVLNGDNYDQRTVEYLLQFGADPDQFDRSNRSPLVTLVSRPYPGFTPMTFTSLKCLSARALGRAPEVKYNDDDIPKELLKFIELHRPFNHDPENKSTVRFSYVRS